ncbi:putative holliday junction resolvase protein [Dioscorea alata]|uniref:Holliday junction resolvase protein n=2 Tax=Dioscorea alata TaxID=55571 RepID=A0ACB7WIW0_DIOAL|nr:putative holliday junction resolvase protein [Dioscorea alata]
MQQLLLPKPKPSSPLLINPRVRVRVRVSVRVPVQASSSSSFSKKLATETELLPNALRRKTNPLWTPRGFTLGVDLGDSRTGLALGKGFSPRPLNVLELRGQKLELRLLEIAEKEEVDEFVIGLPKSHDGKETQQSNKVRSIAGRLAVRAAERGWRVYLQDEHGTSVDALDFMIEMGVKRSSRQVKIDAYSAMMVLERYFSTSGHGAELVLPKQAELQDKIRKGPTRDLDFLSEDIYHT